MTADAEGRVAVLRDLVDGPAAIPDVVAMGTRAVPLLEALLRGRSESVSQPRRLAAVALGMIGTRAAREALRRAMLDSIDRVLDPVLRVAEDEVVAAIANAMAVSPNAEDREILRAALGRRPNAVVAQLLGAIGGVRSIPLLVDCLSDASASAAAAEALRSVGSPAVPALTKAALLPHLEHGREGDTSVRVRAQAVTLLGNIRSAATDLPLVWALHDDEQQVRLGAALALAWRGPPEGAVAIRVLIEALADAPWLVADECAAALATLGAEAFSGVRRTLRASTGGFRERAVRLLERIPHRSATAALVRLSTDRDPRVRGRVACALEEREGAAVERALERLAADPERTVRDCAEAVRRRRPGAEQRASTPRPAFSTKHEFRGTGPPRSRS